MMKEYYGHQSRLEQERSRVEEQTGGGGRAANDAQSVLSKSTTRTGTQNITTDAEPQQTVNYVGWTEMPK